MPNKVYVEEFGSYKTVTWYTLVYEETGIKSAQNFFERMRALGNQRGNDKVKKDLQDLTNWMLNISNSIYGIDRDILRDEQKCNALPNKQVKGLGIRLYCYWVNERIIILFNGGLKTENTAQSCPNVKHHFRQAQIWTKNLAEARVKEENGKIINLDDLYFDA